VNRLAGDHRFDRLLIPASILQRRIAALAAELRRAVPDAPVFDFVVLLKGALAFAKDLGEQLFELDGTGVRYHLFQASTYGDEIKRAGESEREVAIELGPKDISGRDIFLVDDLVDQGFTLAAIRRYLLKEAGVKSLRTCVLLEKRLQEPSEAVQRIRRELPLDHVGFRVPDRWVAGYGIDAAEDFRNLPFIIIVNEQHYTHGR
jgi:hypoxanthine phosphoribosyltransferase